MKPLNLATQITSRMAFWFGVTILGLYAAPELVSPDPVYARAVLLAEWRALVTVALFGAVALTGQGLIHRGILAAVRATR